MEKCNHEYHAKVVAKQNYERWYDGNDYKVAILENQQIEIWCVTCGDIKELTNNIKDSNE